MHPVVALFAFVICHTVAAVGVARTPTDVVVPPSTPIPHGWRATCVCHEDL